MIPPATTVVGGIVTRSTSTDGKEKMLGVCTIKHLLSLHPCLEDLGVYTERVSGKNSEVRVFAHLEKLFIREVPVESVTSPSIAGTEALGAGNDVGATMMSKAS